MEEFDCYEKCNPEKREEYHVLHISMVASVRNQACRISDIKLVHVKDESPRDQLKPWSCL
jgi:hypothetical protein